MPRDWFSIGCAGVVVIAVAFIMSAPESIFHGFIGSAVGAGLGGALFLLGMERSKQDHADLSAALDKVFSVGAGSHMADVAFDKHVAFGEEYIVEVHAMFTTMNMHGPCREALDHARRLYEVRQRHALWLTRVVDDRLEAFERELRTVGSMAHMLDSQVGTNRAKVVTKMYRSFALVYGVEHLGENEWEGEKLDKERSIAGVIDGFRHLLGIHDLTLLRREIIARSIESAGAPHR